MNSFVIGYDITEPKRLQRIHRRMCAHAVPLEYSIFMLDGSATARDACLADVVPLIDAGSDDLRCHALPQRGLQLRLGRPALPEGIVWTGLPGGYY